MVVLWRSEWVVALWRSEWWFYGGVVVVHGGVSEWWFYGGVSEWWFYGAVSGGFMEE